MRVRRHHHHASLVARCVGAEEGDGNGSNPLTPEGKAKASQPHREGGKDSEEGMCPEGGKQPGGRRQARHMHALETPVYPGRCRQDLPTSRAWRCP
eukprot:CAMPEP_0185767092 /NCGR_PEP_ID=MMETSP1174-20130828/41734_1 /TAXON_ID=35687 /ORGANISM="Dictyocha speculum, Strain CCMP1381" /LENGTH=95 /DNA_ID=CAMNT_0028451127 /DNA_START=876 /DNA_END=1163 /DNA_ORIENTATION=+